jgi:hypothetical protein
MSEYKRFLFEYRHEGAEWALELSARDLDDAKARLKALPWAKYKGEVAMKIRLPRPSRLGRILQRALHGEPA